MDRRVASAGVGVLLVAVAAVLLVDGPSDGDGTVPLPPPDEVVAAAVDDHPVFVVHDEDGTVRVLDAVSPHSSFPKVLAWCRSSGRFEDLWHGSRFDRQGRWISGPAPTDMATYELADLRAGQIVVGERRPPRDRPKAARPHDATGPSCDDRTALYGPANPGIDAAVLDDLVIHDDTDRFPDELWFPTPERILGEVPSSPDP